MRLEEDPAAARDSETFRGPFRRVFKLIDSQGAELYVANCKLAVCTQFDVRPTSFVWRIELYNPHGQCESCRLNDLVDDIEGIFTADFT